MIITVILLAGTMNLQEIVSKQAGGLLHWNVLAATAWPSFTALVMIPMSVIFFISALAETKRPPFDLPEAESELVAGYQVEYSSSPFLLHDRRTGQHHSDVRHDLHPVLWRMAGPD